MQLIKIKRTGQNPSDIEVLSTTGTSIYLAFKFQISALTSKYKIWRSMQEGFTAVGTTERQSINSTTDSYLTLIIRNI